MNNISMHILDIAQNSIRAEATKIEIFINENEEKNLFTLSIKDNGFGMDEDFLAIVADPYTTTRTTRKVGMGVPLLKHSAEQSGGYIKVYSERLVGTTIQAVFQSNHIDRPPLGDIAGTIILIAAANPEIEIKYIHQKNNKKYEFNTIEIKEILGDIRINNPKIRNMLKELIQENLKEIYVI